MVMIIEGARDTDIMSWKVQETPWTKHCIYCLRYFGQYSHRQQTLQTRIEYPLCNNAPENSAQENTTSTLFKSYMLVNNCYHQYDYCRRQ